jgi:Protein of unknown function (DUF3006)
MKSQRPARVVIDRIEGDVVVLVLYDDDRFRFNLPAQYLPEGVAEGDHLQMSFSQDEASREAERARVDDLLKELKGT